MKKAFMLILVSLLVVSSLIPLAQASTLYESFSNYSSVLFVSNFHYVQTFQVGAESHTCSSTKLYLYRGGSPSAGTVEFWSVGDDGKPDSLLAFIDVDWNLIGTSLSWVEFEFDSPIELSANTYYAIGIYPNSVYPNGVCWGRWIYDNFDGLSGYSYDGNSWTMNSVYVCHFEIWGDALGGQVVTVTVNQATEVVQTIESNKKIKPIFFQIPEVFQSLEVTIRHRFIIDLSQIAETVQEFASNKIIKPMFPQLTETTQKIITNLPSVLSLFSYILLIIGSFALLIFVLAFSKSKKH